MVVSEDISNLTKHITEGKGCNITEKCAFDCMCKLFIFLVQGLVFLQGRNTKLYFIVKKGVGWGVKCSEIFSLYFACTSL